MKRFLCLLVAACTLSGCATDRNGVRAAIDRQLCDFPQSNLQDIYKSFYQSTFGAEHMITDTASVRAYLHDEIAAARVDTVANPYFEPAGANGEYVRVYLRCITEGHITEQQLLDAFLRSARPRHSADASRHDTRLNRHDDLPNRHDDASRHDNLSHQGAEEWGRLWQEEIVPAALDAGVCCPEEELSALESASRRNMAVRHSADYRNAYHPHYRIVARQIFDNEIMPLLP